MALKAVLFDLWGTLIEDPEHLARPRHEWRSRNVYEALCRHGCSVYEVAAIERALGAASAALSEMHDSGRDLTSAGRADLFLRHLAPEVAIELPSAALTEIEGAITDMRDEYAPALAGDAVETLANAKSAGLGTALISNAGYTTANTLRRMLDGWGLTPHLDVLVFSDEMELAKPHPRMFECALEALGTEPAEAAYVGDSPHNDVAGAKALGLVAVQIGSREKDGVVPDLRIDHLSELLPALEAQGLLMRAGPGQGGAA